MEKSSDKVNNVLDLSLQEISNLIKTCRKNGVLSFKYNGLELDLTNLDHGSIKKNLTKKEIALDESDAKDAAMLDQLEYMKVNDPEAYERLIAEGLNA